MKRTISLFFVAFIASRFELYSQQLTWQEHAIDLWNKTGQGMQDFRVEIGPTTVTTADTQMQVSLPAPADVFSPPNAVWFSNMWQALQSDTITLPGGPTQISFPWLFSSYHLDFYVRADSVLHIEDDVYDVVQQKVIDTAFQAFINTNSFIYDTMSNQWIPGFIVRGLRTFSFMADKGEKIITRTRVNTGALVDTSVLSFSLVDVFVSYTDSAAFRKLYPDLPAEIQNFTTSVPEPTGTPRSFALQQNYPNPFNPATVISYQLAVSSRVTLKVYDILGKEVATLVDEQKQPGSYRVMFDGSRLASGIYFYRLQTGSFTATKKLMLVK
ncbi:MAG TPA: T9SS type A sorting domain-containing protein [Bacteroidota bacterium]|nr:T9SS type A sorting domain-containing protein [Bacteroidota bacterium]